MLLVVVVGIDCQLSTVNFAKRQSGGYSGGVPPLPIPNREVKPVIADGTAMQCGRVGSSLLSLERFPGNGKSLLFLCPIYTKDTASDIKFSRHFFLFFLLFFYTGRIVLNQ